MPFYFLMHNTNLKLPVFTPALCRKSYISKNSTVNFFAKVHKNFGFLCTFVSVMAFDTVKIIDIPKICDPRGNLSFLEHGQSIPFVLERVYWIYDVPGGKKRFGHAFKSQSEIIISLSGSFDVVLNDGNETRRFHLARSYHGLFIPNMMWRELDNFSTNSVALVLSSHKYDPNDYIEDFELFKKMIGNGK